MTRLPIPSVIYFILLFIPSVLTGAEQTSRPDELERGQGLENEHQNDTRQQAAPGDSIHNEARLNALKAIVDEYSKNGPKLPKNWEKLIRPDYWKNIVEMDRSFFFKLSGRKNSITSGEYSFEVGFPGATVEKFEVQLTTEKGKIAINQFRTKLPYSLPEIDPNSSGIFDIHQDGNVISWIYRYSEEGPWSYYVGLIDDDTIWGKVYIMGAAEWYEYPPEIGTWIIRKKIVDTTNR